MSFVGFKVPYETSRIFGAIDVPGERYSFHHITVLNLGDTLPPKELGKAIDVAYRVTSKMKPFSVKTDTISCFPVGDDGVPIICLVESDALHELWERLRDAFDDAGISFSKKFPVFRPHVTLSYSRFPIEDRRITPIEWGAHELVIWAGDGGDRGIVVNLPFNLKAAFRNLITYDLRRNLLQGRVVERFKRRD